MNRSQFKIFLQPFIFLGLLALVIWLMLAGLEYLGYEVLTGGE